VFSFDYIQARQTEQGRKTRFFRRLYGQTQLVKRHLHDGRTVSYSYHYPGILDELPHVRLGKSVFGVQPGTEGPVLDLFESLEEVVFYHFTGWLPVRLWQLANRKPLMAASSLIGHFGYLSVLLAVARNGGSVSRSDLMDSGFDAEYLTAAWNYLQGHGLLRSKPEGFQCTPRGTTIAQSLFPVLEGNGKS
jgi:hypothetical protein